MGHAPVEEEGDQDEEAKEEDLGEQTANNDVLPEFDGGGAAPCHHASSCNTHISVTATKYRRREWGRK